MKLSICIPTYNKPAELNRLLKSIECQTFRDFEIIISDDSDSSEPAKEIIAQFPTLPIRYFFHKPAYEPAQNWNFLLDQAKGEYIKIIHDDDWLLSADALQMFVDRIEMTGGDFVWSNSKNYKNGQVISEHNTSLAEICALEKDAFVLFLGNFIATPSTTIIKNSAIRYDEKLKWYVDIEHYIRILRKSKFAHIDIPLVGVNNNIGRLTDDCITNKDVIYSEFFYCFRKCRLNGILSPIKSYYWLYKFFRLHKPCCWGEINSYCKKYKISSYITFHVYKIKMAIDSRKYKR